MNLLRHELQRKSVQTLSIELGQVSVIAHPPVQLVLKFSHDSCERQLELYAGTFEKEHAGKLAGVSFSETKVSVFSAMKYNVAFEIINIGG